MFSPRNLPATLIVATIAALLGACSSGGSNAVATSTTIARSTKVTARVGAVSVPSPRPMVQFSTEDQDGILAAVEQYIHRATLAPLDGEAVDLRPILSAASAASMSASDRDAVEDNGAPPATGKVDVSLEPVDITALVDENGAIDLAATSLDLAVEAPTAQGPLTIHRSGELTWVREAGAWKILGFTLIVERDGPGLGVEPSTTTGSVP